MNINIIKEKLKEGMIIKNYKELCLLLNEKIKSGASKRSQLKELERYIKYHKDGNKFVIDEIYKETKGKIDNRENGNNSIFNLHIQKLILDLLVLQLEHKHKNIFLSTCKLMESIAMINSNYGFCKENITQLATYLKMDEDNIYEFYQNSYGSLKGALESALNVLTNKSLIIWDTVVTISENIEIEEDERKRIIENHRPATQQEKESIIQAEKDVLIEMGFENKRDIVICKRWKDFIKKVNKILKETEEMNYYYKSYDITFNTYVLQEQNKIEKMLLKNENRQIEKHQLNNKIVNKFVDNAKNRQEKAIDKTGANNDTWFGLPNLMHLNEKEIMRIEEDYINNYEKITDTVININQPKVIADIIRINRENKKEKDNPIDITLDNLFKDIKE